MLKYILDSSVYTIMYRTVICVYMSDHLVMLAASLRKASLQCATKYFTVSLCIAFLILPFFFCSVLILFVYNVQFLCHTRSSDNHS